MAVYLLGIDNGCTMSKAALFNLNGEELAAASRKTDVLTPKSGHVERDMVAMWHDTAAAIREVIAKAKIDAGMIAGIACTGHGNGLYLVDKSGQPVRNAINSTDSRAQVYIDQWRAAGISAKVLPKTTQCLWAAQPNALLSWLRDHEPEVMKKAGWVLMCKDYIRFCLTGAIHAELTDMSGTSLMNVVTGAYDDSVLEAFGIADMKRLLPPLVKTADICGKITAQAAAETGLKVGTPVAGGMFDIDACGLASGIVDERQMSLVAGTWGNNQYIARQPLIDKDLFMTSCYSIPGYYLMLEGSPTSAGNLEWFVSEFLAAESAAARQQGRSVYDVCNEMVAAVPAIEADIVFLPYLYGTNANNRARACWVGIGGTQTRAHVVRSIYEGIVCAHRMQMERLLQFRTAPAVIRFSGGAARSEVWVQMFADSLQVPIEIPAGSEQGALGAAIAASVAVGCHTGYREAVAAMTRIDRRYEPRSNQKEMYTEKYARYRSTAAALNPLWK